MRTSPPALALSLALALALTSVGAVVPEYNGPARITPEYETIHITLWPQTEDDMVADECMEPLPVTDTHGMLPKVPDFCCQQSADHHETMALPRLMPFHPLRQCTTFEYDGGGPKFRGLVYLGCDGLVNGHRVPTYGERCWPTWWIPPDSNLTAIDDEYNNVTSPEQCGPVHCLYHAVGAGCYRINMLSDIGEYIHSHPDPAYPDGLAEAYENIPTAGFISMPDHCHKYSAEHLKAYVRHHEMVEEVRQVLEGSDEHPSDRKDEV